MLQFNSINVKSIKKIQFLSLKIDKKLGFNSINVEPIKRNGIIQGNWHDLLLWDHPVRRAKCWAGPAGRPRRRPTPPTPPTPGFWRRKYRRRRRRRCRYRCHPSRFPARCWTSSTRLRRNPSFLQREQLQWNSESHLVFHVI